MKPTAAEVSAIVGKMTRAQRRNIVDTPHPQPMEGHWFWPGSVSQAFECALLGLLDDSGLTPLGLAVRSHLQCEGNSDAR